MAEKNTGIQKELEKASNEGKLKVGLKTALRSLRQGTTEKIFYADNTPKKLKEEILHYAGISEVPAIEFPGDSKDLGVLCKRTHNTLIATVVKT